MKMTAKHRAGTNSAVGILACGIANEAHHGRHDTAADNGHDDERGAIFGVLPQIFDPQGKDGGVLNRHKCATQRQRQQAKMATAEGGDQTQNHGEQRVGWRALYAGRSG
ncbi:Uncharacterised protein [Kluyvera cryocrescens]|uniref:Uncharacterized protein n=1 Tax=Kluyvera cryocrescens TaxID=580 RepID=A0A485ATP3_KLUCR|nr:Uncharacterised protein [Kluyvera cryocrescens]